MAHDVMISFSSRNLTTVEKILRRLEDSGLRCWVSYRDVKPGENYQESITGAIRMASAVVFVMCREFNFSEETKRELSLASTFRKPMVPIRTEDFELSDALRYSLATVQYINAFPDFDFAVERTIARLKEFVAGNPVAAPGELPTGSSPAFDVQSDSDRAAKYTDIARQAYADGIVTLEERGRLDMAREFLALTPEVARRIESQFQQTVQTSTRKPFAVSHSAEAQPWNGFWLVNVGEGPYRTWDDNLRFGYMGAGQGVRYRNALHRLSVGDRIFAYLKGVGYVGYGEVTSSAVMIKDFRLPDGALMLQSGMRAPLAAEHADDPDLCEWAVGVAWKRTVPRHSAIKFPGIFTSQHAVCRLSDEKTLEALRATFVS